MCSVWQTTNYCHMSSAYYNAIPLRSKNALRPILSMHLIKKIKVCHISYDTILGLKTISNILSWSISPIHVIKYKLYKNKSSKIISDLHKNLKRNKSQNIFNNVKKSPHKSIQKNLLFVHVQILKTKCSYIIIKIN